MSSWERDIAFRYAPVVLQKAHSDHFRADFITRVDLAHDWPEVWRNWTVPWEKKADGSYRHRLEAHGYYSVVATHTHFFLTYAFYHPQDWSAFWGSPARSSPGRPDQHLHDMEGCLVIVPRADDSDLTGRGAVAMITISHFHFFSFAGWEGASVDLPFNVSGWKEDVDGPILITDRFAADRREPPWRPKLFVQAQGHGIKGSRDGWGDGDLVVRYRPTTGSPGEPGDTFTEDGDIWTQTVPYRLLVGLRPRWPVVPARGPPGAPDQRQGARRLRGAPVRTASSPAPPTRPGAGTTPTTPTSPGSSPGTRPTSPAATSRACASTPASTCTTPTWGSSTGGAEKEAHAGTLANLLPQLRSRDLDERARAVGVG